MTDDHRRLRCLVTGATGYIGGRLVPELLAAGHRRAGAWPRTRRACATTPGRATSRSSRPTPTDAGAAARAALDGVDVAYYLIHALGHRPGFEETDRRDGPHLRRRGPRAPASAASSTSAA